MAITNKIKICNQYCMFAPPLISNCRVDLLQDEQSVSTKECIYVTMPGVLLTEGTEIRIRNIRISVDNAYINFNDTGEKQILSIDKIKLSSITENMIITYTYDGTNWLITN